MMRDVLITAGAFLLCWGISLFIREGRAATAQWADTARQWLPKPKTSPRSPRPDNDSDPDRLETIMRAVRWSMGVGHRAHHVYTFATASSKGVPSSAAQPQRAEISPGWTRVHRVFRFAYRIVRDSHIPAVLWTRARGAIYLRSRSTSWAVTLFAVSLVRSLPPAPG